MRTIFSCLFMLIPWGLSGQSSADPTQLTLERIFDAEEFNARTPDTGAWLADGTGYLRIEEEGTRIVIRWPDTGEVREVLASSKGLTPAEADGPLQVTTVQWSNDLSVLLLQTPTDGWWLLLKEGNQLRPLADDMGGEVALPQLSPMGDRVAFVWNRNLHAKDVATGRTTQLTDDGSKTVVNADGDVYLGMNRGGFQWSSDGRWIAFSQFQTDGVPEYRIINNTVSKYPEVTTFPYVKPGDRLPAARLGVVAATGGAVRWIALPGDPRNHYVNDYEWVPGRDELLVRQLARPPKELRLFHYDVAAGSLREVLAEEDEAWLDPRPIRWISEGDTTVDDGTPQGTATDRFGAPSFLWLSERNGWRQVFRVDLSSGHATLLTPGEYDVDSLEGLDSGVAGSFYFLASPRSSTERFLFRGRLDGSDGVEQVTPTGAVGTHEYDIAPGGRWAWRTHSTRDTPPVTDVVSLPSHATIREVEDNGELAERLSALGVQPTEFFQVEIGEGVELDGWIIRPASFDPSRRYPVVVHVYGMPALQTVLDRWNPRLLLFHRLLSQRGYVVLSVDNRGTPALKGRAWRRSIYLRHGLLPAQDQAAAVTALEARWPWLDPERTAIYGWSGGGNVSMNAILHHPEVFELAMPGAGISDHRLYHAGFTERFLGLPQEHPEAYDATAPARFAENLTGSLLLIHGTGDPNVHFQNAEMMVNALIRAKKQFTFMPYPNRPHGVPDRHHLHALYLSFLEERLLPGPRIPLARDPHGS